MALVTGAGQGVGREIVRKLAGCGAQGVVVNDYFAERADAVAAELAAAGFEAMAVQGDVTSLDSVKAMAARATERFGRIDILGQQRRQWRRRTSGRPRQAFLGGFAGHLERAPRGQPQRRH